MVNLCPSCPLKWGSLLHTGILSSFFLSVPLGYAVPLQLELLKHSVLFPSSLHWMWCRAVSTELQVLTQICLRPAIWRETWIKNGGNGWENSCDHDMNRAGTGQSMLVPSDLGAGTQWVLSYPSGSPTACWSCGEGEKEASPWGFAAAAELRVTPLLLSSHKTSHPLWAETLCEGLPPPPPPCPQQFILEPGPGCYTFGAYWHVPGVFLLIPFPCQSLCIGLSPQG